MQEEERLSLREAADALGVSEVTARRWIKSGKLAAYQPGRKYLVPRSAVDGLLESESPKAGRSSLEPSLFNGLEDERRLHYLKPWASYVSTLANNVEHEIEQGHVTDLNWGQEFNRNVLTLTFLYERILPPHEAQTEEERLELLKFSEAIDRLNEVADKMDRAMDPIIAEMHKEMYAREREQRKATLKLIHGRLSA